MYVLAQFTFFANASDFFDFSDYPRKFPLQISPFSEGKLVIFPEFFVKSGYGVFNFLYQFFINFLYFMYFSTFYTDDARSSALHCFSVKEEK